jgi:3D (Asp-Asp-Asp) domain-containing protein
LKTKRLGAAMVMAALFVAPSARAQDPSDTDAAPVNPAADWLSVAKVVLVRVTGYANGADGGAVGNVTASGVRTHWGTVAADPRVFPLGTRLLIEGFAGDVFTVEDTGGAIRGNHIDVWFPNRAAALTFGSQSLRVSVLR